MRRPVEAGDASSHADVEQSVVEIHDDVVANLERPSANDYQLRMLCTMFTALSHPGSGGDDTMREGMLEDLIHMARDLIQDLKAAKGELKDKDTKTKARQERKIQVLRRVTPCSRASRTGRLTNGSAS
jgi:hypothetical protein